MQVGFITTYMQSVPITTNVVSWNSTQARCTRYNKFVSDLQQAGDFLKILWCPTPIKLTTTI